jgi:hypothetical protein
VLVAASRRNELFVVQINRARVSEFGKIAIARHVRYRKIQQPARLLGAQTRCLVPRKKIWRAFVDLG